MTGMNPRLSVAFQGNKTLSEYAALAARAEDFGFGTISVYNDLMFQPAMPALMAMASATRIARLGPACLNPFTLHPVEIAGQMAMLDAASNGRAYLGLARGAWLDTVGIRPRRPVVAIREAVAAIRYLLSGGEGGLTGEFFSVEQGQRLQYDLHRRDVPLLIGTWGARLGELGGGLASEVKVGGSANPAMVRVMREHVTRGAARAGRPAEDVAIVLGAVTVVDNDCELARARAREEVARYLPVVAPFDPSASVDPELLARVAEAVRIDEYSTAARLISDDLLERFAFAGAPADIVRQAESVLAAGAGRVEFGTPHGLTAGEGLRLLGERVLPALR